MTNGECPLIIWTLRRTGGTNLASHVGVKYHEPFNNDRIFGDVSKSWREKLDRAELRLGVAKALHGNPSIKHCVETVPDEVTQELVRQSVKKGYQHIFLIRRKPDGRVLSLQFASSFGIWGAEHAKKKPLDEIESLVSDQVLPIESMIEQEIKDRKTLKQTYEQILSEDAIPAIAVFEDVYDSFNAPVSIALFERLCNHVGVAHPENDEELAKILFSGGQNTNEKYRLYRNYPEYLKEIAKIGVFSLGGRLPTLKVDRADFHEDAVIEIFEPRQSWRSDLVRIEGIAFQSSGERAWRIFAGELEIPAIWNLPSPRFAKRVGLHAGGTSRFVALDVPLEHLASLSFHN